MHLANGMANARAYAVVTSVANRVASEVGIVHVPVTDESFGKLT